MFRLTWPSQRNICVIVPPPPQRAWVQSKIIWKRPSCERSNTVMDPFPSKFLPILTADVLRPWKICKIKPLMRVLQWICLPRYWFPQMSYWIQTYQQRTKILPHDVSCCFSLVNLLFRTFLCNGIVNIFTIFCAGVIWTELLSRVLLITSPFQLQYLRGEWVSVTTQVLAHCGPDYSHPGFWTYACSYFIFLCWWSAVMLNCSVSCCSILLCYSMLCY